MIYAIVAFALAVVSTLLSFSCKALLKLFFKNMKEDKIEYYNIIVRFALLIVSAVCCIVAVACVNG